MNNKNYKLSEVSEIVTGKTPSTKHPEFFGSFIPFVTPADLGQTMTISGSKRSLSKLGSEQVRIVPQNTVLVCCIGATIGKVGLTSLPVTTNQQINAVIFNEEFVLPKYGYYFCKTLKNILRHLASSTTVPIINKSQFSNLPIPVPPISTQEEIVQSLDKVERLKEKRTYSIRLFTELLQATFLEFFGDPSLNPNNWETSPLGDLIIDGPQNGLYKHSSSYEPSGLPILRIDCFYDGQITPNQEFKRVIVSDDEAASWSLNAGDIVINRVNSLSYLGKSALIEDLGETTLFESNMMRFSVDTEVVNPTYLIEFLQTNFVKTKIQQMAKKAINQASINQKDVKSIPIVIPNMQLQLQFQEIRERILNLSKSMSQSQRSLESLADSWSDSVFSIDKQENAYV